MISPILIEYKIKDGSKDSKYIDKKPDVCPSCGFAIDAIFQLAYSDDQHGSKLQVIFQCPRNECGRFQIAHYVASYTVPPSPSQKWKVDYYLSFIEPKPRKRREFKDEISELSPMFVKIYNQAFDAEQSNLDEIAGPGYRKALEYLIKDFACRSYPDRKDEILQKYLGDCIKTYVDDQRIRASAERATWLGNDETHYLRRWTGKDINDLKILIDLTVNWVTNVLLTDKYIVDMPTKS